jgi:hypothetical protein
MLQLQVLHRSIACCTYSYFVLRNCPTRYLRSTPYVRSMDPFVHPEIAGVKSIPTLPWVSRFSAPSTLYSVPTRNNEEPRLGCYRAREDPGSVARGGPITTAPKVRKPRGVRSETGAESQPNRASAWLASSGSLSSQSRATALR